MFAAIAIIAEQRIREAMDAGEFDNLPGKGLPLDLGDDADVPQDLRMAYKLLKNAGYVPHEVSGKEAHSLRDLMPNDAVERKRLRQLQKMEILLSRAGFDTKRLEKLEVDSTYFEGVVSRVDVRDKGGAK